MSKYEDPSARRTREFQEAEQRRAADAQRIVDEALRRFAANPGAVVMAGAARSIGRLGGTHWEGTAEPGQPGFERDGWQPQPMAPEDASTQNLTRVLFHQANAGKL